VSHALEALRSAIEVAMAARLALASPPRRPPAEIRGDEQNRRSAASEDHRAQHRRRPRQTEGDRLRVLTLES
jgi:hypothetical protein